MTDQSASPSETVTEKCTMEEKLLQMTETLITQITVLEKQIDQFCHISDYEQAKTIAIQLDQLLDTPYEKHAPSSLITEVIHHADIAIDALHPDRLKNMINRINDGEDKQDTLQNAKTVDATVGFTLVAITEELLRTLQNVRTLRALQAFYFIENTSNPQVQHLLAQIQAILQLETTTTSEEYYEILNTGHTIQAMINAIIRIIEDPSE